MPDNSSMSVQPTRNAVAAILGGIVVITLTFLTYRYFNKPEQPEVTGGSTFDETSSATTEENKNAPTDTKKPAGNNAVAPKNNGSVFGSATNNTSWVATDYKSGEIKESSYKVKAGDTLWELAEAKYGDGHQWVKIRDANKSSVGFLPNGSQALIVTGQMLLLP